MIRSAAVLTLALATPAGAFELAFPVACTLGDTCYIQQYVDHDAGPAARDFTCGTLSYQDHDGTDIALPNRAAMLAGVNVLAAAAGTVEGLRDGVADFEPFPPGQDCGNGVLLDHGDGWQTQYCHMKQGSVVVQVGQAVQTGTVLGQIGQSGRAEFPHVHLSLRHNGNKLDPFAPDAPTDCGGATNGLWAAPIPYQPGGIIGAGIAPAIPEYAAIKAGLANANLPTDAPALVVWALLYGSQAGDTVQFSLAGPNGAVLNEQVTLEKPQAQLFRAVGKKRKGQLWPQGRYSGTATLLRQGKTVSTEQTTIMITP